MRGVNHATNTVETVLALRDTYNLLCATQRIAKTLPDVTSTEEILPPTKVEEIQDCLENLTKLLNSKGIAGRYERVRV